MEKYKTINTVCASHMCNGCMACVNVCSKKAIKVKDYMEYFDAEINSNICINCGACERVCPNNSLPIMVKPYKWYQGWAINPQIRLSSSSGGVGTEIAKKFAERGGYVCACLFKEGEFIFQLTKKVEEVSLFAGSKYVKSNPKTIFKEIKEKLKENKVLFIGLPCQVAGLTKYVGNTENLFTIDLICHGTPSHKVLEKFLSDNNITIKMLSDIKFRVKHDFGLIGDYNKISKTGDCDFYTKAFLSGISYTENCYSCGFAKLERCSDLTIGDSWGSELSIEQQKNGLSLILCQTQKGEELLGISDFELKEVDLNTAVNSNHQLKKPSQKTKRASIFLRGINKGINFNLMFLLIEPNYGLRQVVKSVIHRGGNK